MNSTEIYCQPSSICGLQPKIQFTSFFKGSPSLKKRSQYGHCPNWLNPHPLSILGSCGALFTLKLQHYSKCDKTAYNFILSASENVLGFWTMFFLPGISKSLKWQKSPKKMLQNIWHRPLWRLCPNWKIFNGIKQYKTFKWSNFFG